MQEWDVTLILTCYSRIEGTNKKARQPALIDVFGIQKAIAAVLFANGSLGGRVCDSLLQKGGRGYDAYDEGTFAVTNTPLIINPRELGR